MATELQPPASPFNFNNSPSLQPQPTTTTTTTTTENPNNPNSSTVAPPKRHRRPSVRLGDIGDQPATLRTSKSSWHRELKSSKIRPLTNLNNSNNNFNPISEYSPETPTTTTTNNNNINGNPHRKFPKEFKSKRTTTGAKRVRQNPDFEERENTPNNIHTHIHTHNNEDEDHGDDEGFRDFDPEASDQDQDHHSPQNDDDAAILDAWHGHNRRSIRASAAAATNTTTTRVSDSRHQDLELDPESDSRSRGFGSGLDDGVRNWLVGLGLGRYAPVFEIHEVDDEVLPYLTLEDLKDMGITAVGSRRKLYSAIQKLRKGLS